MVIRLMTFNEGYCRVTKTNKMTKILKDVHYATFGKKVAMILRSVEKGKL